MSTNLSIADRAPWLHEPGLQRLLAMFAAEGEEARIVGGAVRNTLLVEEVGDIDIATTCLPEETQRRALAAGFRAIDTGSDHGTITVIVEGRPYEVTTLRSDIDTDGRHAQVAFGRDWDSDARRRDFTINALYADADGTIVDLVGGVADIEARVLRFIGDPEERIKEDYLRILRFFRFFAWYGKGRPESEGLKACARLKDGMARLSAERIWSELKKLLAAPDPSRALLWMRQAGVLTAVLPESEKWGIDAIHGLVKAEQGLGWHADPLLRLESIVPPDAARMDALSTRLKLANGERDRLLRWAETVMPSAEISEAGFARRLYRSDVQGMTDRLRLELASARAKAEEDNGALMRAGHISKLLAQAGRYERPRLPITGGDIVAAGIPEGPRVGELQRRLEEEWVQSGFSIDRAGLLSKLREAAAES